MSKFAKWAVSAVLILLGLGASPLCPQAQTGPLRIISEIILPSSESGAQPGFDLIVLTLRNESAASAMSWDVSCLHATSEGNFSVAAGQAVHLLDVGMYQADGPASESRGPITTGSIREMSFPRSRREASAPFAATSCAVTAVIFADGTFSGVPSRVGALLEERVKQGVDTHDPIGLLAAEWRPPPVEPLRTSALVISHSDSSPKLTNSAEGVVFDFWGNAEPERTAWTAAGSDAALLALDRNGNGQIDGYAELIGRHSPQLPSDAHNGWLALEVWDDSLNGGTEDGVIDVQDRIFEDLLVWNDSNHNGVSESSELSNLEDSGIKTLRLSYDPESGWVDGFGNDVRYPSSVVWNDGSETTAWDVFFARQR